MVTERFLPPELLSLVFAAVYNDSKDKAKSMMARTSYELVDTLLVCRRWKDIAYQTAELWTTVYVAHDPDASVRAQTYANRARGLEIDIIVTALKKFSSENCGKAFEQLLHKHSPRLRSITLPFLTSHISASLRNPLPNLLSFTYTPILPYDYHWSDTSVILDTPKLQSLVLYNLDLSFVGDDWPSLRNLDCIFSLGQEKWVWSLLGASKKTLESLVLFDSDNALETWDAHSLSLGEGILPCTSFPNLTSLEVGGFEHFDWSTLRSTEMPALRSLTLSLVCLPEFEDEESPLPTFEHVRHLSITSSFEDPDDLQPLLESTPNIISLEVCDISEEGDLESDQGHIIDCLLSTSEMPLGGPLLCPNLEEIQVLGISIDETKVGELGDLRLPVLRKMQIGGRKWANGSWLN